MPVSLPVREDATPPPADITTIAANDQLALAVLDPNVPVPVFATKNGATDFNVLSYAWYLEPTAATVTAPSPNPIGGFADLTGFQVLMNADLTPTDAGAPAGGGGAPAAAGGAPAGAGGNQTPVVGLPRQRIPVRRGTATIPIQCLVVDCTGTLALQNARAAGAPKAASTARVSKRVTYASTRFAVAAGKTASVKAKLRASGRKLLKRHRAPKVWANVTFAGGAAKSFRVSLIR